jgi:hypothetical protein
MNFGSTHGYLFGDNYPIHENLKSLADWMISAVTISILERLASKHPKFYERVLATVDIRVQEFISSCADAVDVDAIETSLLDFETLKQQLRLQNSSGLESPVFPDSADISGPAKKRGSDDLGGSDGQPAKAKTTPNRNPHPSLALGTYAEWDKVRKYTSCVPKVAGVDVCTRFHCRKVCNRRCEHVHGRLAPSVVTEMEAWVIESKAKHARGDGA